MSQSSSLTLAELISTASGVLENCGYTRAQKSFPEWDTTVRRLFEDQYSIIGIAAFSTCAKLIDSWSALQGSLVDVMSQQLGVGESKVWDGYLILLTAGIAPSGDLEIQAIRRDTTRLRKLVATGDDLTVAGDVERVLRPLLPLSQDQISVQHSTLDLLPELLQKKDIGKRYTGVLLRAFRENKPLLEALHNIRGEE